MRPPTLFRLVARRILGFALLAMAIQIGVVFADYWFDDGELGRLMVDRETGRLAEGVRRHDGVLGFRLPAALREAYAPDDRLEDGAIFARVRDAAGTLLFSSCEADCDRYFVPLSFDHQTFWQRSIEPGKPLSVAGGRSFTVAGDQVMIEIAVIRDPEGFLFGVLLHEMLDHMLVPMALMLVLVIGATILSIRAALRPVAAAAAAADRIDPQAAATTLATAGMPSEIAHLTEAVNRAFGRVGDLIRSQRIFASAIAHEIRTPVAIVRLELARIDDPRARKAEADLDDLTHMLEQLTSLARLDAVAEDAFATIDLRPAVGDTVASIAPFVYDRGASIDFVDAGSARVRVVPGLLEAVVRNLVENAVKHNPAGTRIEVAVGPGPVLMVRDDGRGFDRSGDTVLEVGRVRRSGALGLGIRIVERIAHLHRATVEIDSGPGTGTRVTVTFPPVVVA
jgi:signal transduction histidine kinase